MRILRDFHHLDVSSIGRFFALLQIEKRSRPKDANAPELIRPRISPLFGE